MPTESEPKASSESSSIGQRLLAKCLSFPNLSVRSRYNSEEKPNRRVMTAAELNDKKRKRDQESPNSADIMPIKMTRSKQEEPKDVSGFFDKALQGSDHKKYAQDRQRLLEDEGLTAWDSAMRQDASHDEEKAGQIIWGLREYERSVTFGNNASEAIPGPDTRDMGGQFLTNKVWIETRSLLFEIAKAVPKGALLHLHFNAELYPEMLLEKARDMPNMYIRSIRPLLTLEDLDLTEMVYNILPEGTHSANIFSEDYKGTNTNFKDPEMTQVIWMKWECFREDFKANTKFRETFEQRDTSIMINGRLPNSSHQGKVKLDAAENWILQKMVLSEEEAYRPTQTVNGVWARFNQATRCFKGLLNYEGVYEWYIDKAIDRMIDEKVMYAELRPMLMDKSIPSDDATKSVDNAEQMRIISRVVERKKAQLKADGKEDEFPFGLKIIYCTPRSIPRPKMISEMKDCIELKVQFPQLICGFDLVGAEDRPNHIGFYKEELLAFKETCRAKNLDIPFLFHAGETLLDTGGSTDPNNSNLYDAVLLESKRIGHGFSLMKHPHLIEKFKYRSAKEPGICVELCPISNELLHLCRNIKEHPYPELLAAGIPCTVNSDNPSLFSNSMSHEFYQVMVGAPTISIYSWKQLALWSIDYSCLTAAEKKKGKRIFLQSWDEFCKNVVKNYEDLFEEVVKVDDLKVEVDRKGGYFRKDDNGNKVKVTGTATIKYVLDESKAKASFEKKRLEAPDYRQ